MVHVPRERRSLSGLAAVTVCAALLAAACTGSPPTSSGGNPQAGPVPQPQPTEPSYPASYSPPGPTTPARHSQSRSAPAATTPSTPRAPAPVPSCPTADLRGSFGTGTGAAGTFYYPIELTNTSGSACTLFGYPGVSVVNGPGGSQIGQPAVRISTFAPTLVTIPPGGIAHAQMQTPNAGMFSVSACQPVTVHWLRVYPPDQFTSLYISVPTTPNPVQICTGTHLGGAIPLGIFVVMPGSTGP